MSSSSGVMSLEAKIVVLGSQGVGKTSLVLRYIGKLFSNTVSPTIGASFFTFKLTVENHRVKLQLWDTAGQERFRSMAPMYYRKANAAMLVYDITSLTSFEAIQSWVNELKRNVEGRIVMCLVGNKSDMESQRAVDRAKAQEYADSIDAYFFETSALTDTGVRDAFLQVSIGLIRLNQELGVGSDEEESGRLSRGAGGNGAYLRRAGSTVEMYDSDEEDGRESLGFKEKCCTVA